MKINKQKWAMVVLVSMIIALACFLIFADGGSTTEMGIAAAIYLVAFICMGKASDNFREGEPNE